MRLSEQGLKFIASYETSSGEPNLKAVKSVETYKDGSPKYEIGWGHTSNNVFRVTKNTVITYEQAVAILQKDVQNAEQIVNSFNARHEYNLKQHEFDALVSLAYNGVPFWLYSTGIYKALLSRDEEQIAYEWNRWNKATVGSKKLVLNGLVRRRKDELNVFFKGVYERTYD